MNVNSLFNSFVSISLKKQVRNKKLKCKDMKKTVVDKNELKIVPKNGFALKTLLKVFQNLPLKKLFFC